MPRVGFKPKFKIAYYDMITYSWISALLRPKLQQFLKITLFGINPYVTQNPDSFGSINAKM